MENLQILENSGAVFRRAQLGRRPFRRAPSLSAFCRRKSSRRIDELGRVGQAAMRGMGRLPLNTAFCRSDAAVIIWYLRCYRLVTGKNADGRVPAKRIRT